MKIRRTLELGLFCALYVGAVAYICATSPQREPIHIIDIQTNVAEVKHAPAAVEEVPVEPAVEVSRRSDPEPPAIPSAVIVASAKPEPAPQPIAKAQPLPQPVPQQPQPPQCQPVCRPEPACRRHGIGGLFQWLDPISR
jgi:outer membrane biosynthesis protein TonB